MSDALTVDEVERYARQCRSSLLNARPGKDTHPGVRYAIRRAIGDMDELLFLCELVRNVDAGLGVVVDPEDVPPA